MWSASGHSRQPTQLVKIPTAHEPLNYTHDDAGNIIDDDTYDYIFGDSNRLVEVEDGGQTIATSIETGVQYAPEHFVPRVLISRFWIAVYFSYEGFSSPYSGLGRHRRDLARKGRRS